MLMKYMDIEPEPTLLVPDADSVLFANRVEKTYPNGTRALDEVRLIIQRGDFVSLLGPSGCGKSTLLKMFAGLESPSHGHLRWQGADAPGKSGLKIAMVFQEATLMPWASVAANVRLPLDLAGVPKAESESRVQQALNQVGLGRFGNCYPRELSGGMQMRASIARALVTEPDVLLMDEPFGALDEFTRNKLDADLRSLWAAKAGQLSVIFVTHSIYEAVYLSSRVVMMAARPGRIVADLPIPEPQRDEEFRLSPAFTEHCRDLSARLLAASGGELQHD
ncbi:ABC transporter ATP-binding protein [Uliginosibacterium sp. 31-12]|uniref:ABC transporter ATP-binding protein n=1 Tax=Uliginosibacterium sp. 31-12 TaxID=3062781 RepID=UPI0026E15C1A|nr:ABC transporter ATP-binding protein [Uliginosibacterium sp. 31-12]MDO6388121.1 ABC transporter ATP-binding protein [Uliginosibacterium sp. 31-12]